MAEKPVAIAFYSDTLWKSAGGHYFRLWHICTWRADCWELTNDATQKWKRYTEEQLRTMVTEKKLERVWE